MATPNHLDVDSAPPQPRSVLRGHKAQVHAVTFLRSNERLLTGDADGFVIAWDLTIMRPRAVWQAHDNAILGIAEWGPHNIITHGRDNRLIVWKLSADDEPAMSTALPLDPVPEPRPKPWMLHLLHVNAMNFCSFASCPATALTPARSLPSTPRESHDLLIAVPNTLALEAVDIHHLPSQNRIHTVKLHGDHGMPMALALVWLDSILSLIVAYEDGTAIVARLKSDGLWSEVYRSQCHKQPVLSLHVSPDLESFFTSSADAIIAKHPLLPRRPTPVSLVHASPRTAALDDEQHPLCTPEDKGPDQDTSKHNSISLLSAAIASNHAGTVSTTLAEEPESVSMTQPIKVVDTRHTGQQGLKVRSDGRIFATAGWDSKIRVYSARSMLEVAVLKWHPVGCFALAFTDLSATDTGKVNLTASKLENNNETLPEARSLVCRISDTSVKNKRLNRVRNAHWLAAGSKDGKVSLWDVF